MKYLIVGLGNIGEKYRETRHNTGFNVLDALASVTGVVFTDKRYGSVCNIKYKGRTLILLKPSTLMNLSGNAVNYWLKKEKIDVANMLIIVDDTALPLGSIRMRPKGSAGGHNGLAHIISTLGTSEFTRIRIGIGNNFSKGGKCDFVLSPLDQKEKTFMKERISLVIEMIRSFAFLGTELTMTNYNKAGKISSGIPGDDDKKTDNNSP